MECLGFEPRSYGGHPLIIFFVHLIFFSVDHALVVGCKHEIKTHCQEHTEPNGILNCLKVRFEHLEF